MSSGRRAVVVGGGLFGLAGARALSRRGWKVDVLEAGPAPGHEWSGSKGGARIFRLGYPEAHYVDMAQRAAALWMVLEAATGRRLLRRTGQASLGDGDVLEAVADALETAGAPAVLLSASEVRDRFGLLATDGPVLFEPESGVLAADECLRALCEDGDFELHTCTHVTEVLEHASSVVVTTADRRRFEADVVVLCAGPHSLGLLGRPGAAAAPPSSPQVAYFRPKIGQALEHDVAALPVFIEWGADMLYGLPVHHGAEHGGTYKVSHHTPGTPLGLHRVAHGEPPVPDDVELLARVTAAVQRLLPSLDPEPVATERCVYDNSADGDFVLDRSGRVVVGCASSGHGFKFGPLIGEILADLAEGEPPAVDLSPFCLDRRRDD